MKTIDYCICILADYINGEKTDAPDDLIKWDKVIRYFKCHELTGVLYYQCKHFVPQNFKNELEEQYASLMYYYNNRVWLEKKLKNVLMENEISSFSVKGLSVAEYYPHPALRTMGDTDIVVHSEDRERVHELLLSMGFTTHSKLPNREWQYFYSDMELELHDHLIYYELTNDEVCDKFFNSFGNYISGGKLDWSFHFLFLIYHIRKHFMNRGVGFRHFFDIAILTKNNNELNWQWIKEKLIELHMWEFAQRIFYLNKCWFREDLPFDVPTFDSSFLHDATKQIFENGIFGFDDRKNDTNYTIHSIRYKHKKNYGIRRVWTTLFPNYDTMIKMEYYSFINNRRYLLPVAWGYRFGRAIKHKKAKGNMKAVIDNSFVSKKVVKDREDILKKWGLE